MMGWTREQMAARAAQECDKPRLRLVELAPGVSLNEVRARTGAAFSIDAATGLAA